MFASGVFIASTTMLIVETPLAKGKTMNKKLVEIAVAAVVAGAVTGICQAAYDAKNDESNQEK
nr:MAG TPA: hypothetical protein [Caudoviricetes sp.]